MDKQLSEILSAVFADGVYWDGNTRGIDDTPLTVIEAIAKLKQLINEARINELQCLGMIAGVNIEVNEYLKDRINELREGKDI